MAASAPPPPDKLEGGGGPAPPPAPPSTGRKQGKAGLQMKSPEKKRRKSNTQGPAYSHLTEFAPPPTPMVDHLVASNPFEDDFGAPKEPHSGSPAAAVNGNQPSFPPNSSGRSGGTPDANSLAPPGKAGGGSGPQPPPGLVYPCGACRSEVNDDQDAILCEASCQKWFHRECTGMTESAYGLLTTEASAVWACDLCLKTKEIQSVYIREGMGQLVAANDG
ncbi:Pygopus2 [Manis javanica]|nr:Pygopus2 [Manis javanica]